MIVYVVVLFDRVDCRPEPSWVGLGRQCSQHPHVVASLQGNLILADSNYEVLTLLRSHRDDAKGFAIMARHPYPIHTIRLRQPLSQGQLSSALDSADEKQTLRGMVLGWLELHWELQQVAGNQITCLPLASINNQPNNWCWGWTGASDGNMAGSELYQVSDLRLFQHIFFVSYGYQSPTPPGLFWSQSRRCYIWQWLVLVLVHHRQVFSCVLT